MKKSKVLIAVVVATLGTVATCFAETPVGTVAAGYRSLLYAADVPSNAEGPGLLETDLDGNVYIAFNVQGVHKLLPDLNGDTYSDGLVQIMSHNVRPSFVKLSQDGRYLFTGDDADWNRLVEYDLQTDTQRNITFSIRPIDITTRIVGDTREFYQHNRGSDNIYKIVDLDPADDHTDSAELLFDPPGDNVNRFVLRWGPGVTSAGDYGTRLYYAPGSAIYRADVDATTPATELFSEFDCLYFDFDRWGDFGGYMYAKQGNSIYQIMPDGTTGQVLASYSEVVRDLVFAKDGSALYVGVGDDIVAITLIPEPAPGDFNLDGKVDGIDFAHWQIGYPTPTGAVLWDGDADGDGDVDGTDFGIVASQLPHQPGRGCGYSRTGYAGPAADWRFGIVEAT